MRWVFLCGKEEKDEWKKTRKNKSQDILSQFQTQDPSHPNHVSRRCKPLRTDDEISAIPWVYKGL